MKPQLLIASDDSTHSFTVRHDDTPVNSRWHYHAELELIYFNEAKGTRFIGDSINRFCAGEVFLIGAYLPHYWKIEKEYFGNHKTENFSLTVVHFKENFLGDVFLNIPENKVLKKVFEQAKRGLQISGQSASIVAGIMKQLLVAEGPKRILLLIEVLLIITESSDIKPLSCAVFKTDLKEIEKKRVNIIYDYALANMDRVISLKEIASVANLSPKSFCRYFKSITRKTFSQFVMEIRVGHACKLLIEANMELKAICYECGFNNLAGFHKCFKKLMGKSPKQYQKELLPAKS